MLPRRSSPTLSHSSKRKRAPERGAEKIRRLRLSSRRLYHLQGIGAEDAVICVRQLIAEPRPAAGSSLHNLGPAQQRKRGRNNACAHSSLTLLPRLAAPQEERRDLAGAGLQFVRVSPRSALVDADTRQTIGSILLANAVEVDEGARALDQPVRMPRCQLSEFIRCAPTQRHATLLPSLYGCILLRHTTPGCFSFPRPAPARAVLLPKIWAPTRTQDRVPANRHRPTTQRTATCRPSPIARRPRCRRPS